MLETIAIFVALGGGSLLLGYVLRRRGYGLKG